MALTDDSTMIMPVAPTGNNGFGLGNGDLSWLILLLLCGWGGGFGFGGMGGFGAMGMMDGFGLYPWLNNSQNINDGFREQMLNTNVTSIRDGISDISTQLCGGFAGVNAGVANGFAQAEIAANGRQMANMNQAFGAQTAMMQGFNSLGSQFADCCCENRLGLADLKYTVATENCADRAALNEGVRDIIASQTAGTQRILDQLCADKIDAKNDEIAQLRQEVLYARGQASQIAQNQAVIDGIYNRLDTCPVGTTPVYGRTPIFTCNNGCGCAA